MTPIDKAAALTRLTALEAEAKALRAILDAPEPRGIVWEDGYAKAYLSEYRIAGGAIGDGVEWSRCDRAGVVAGAKYLVAQTIRRAERRCVQGSDWINPGPVSHYNLHIGALCELFGLDEKDVQP